jgi:hypothetical protein
MLYTQYLLKDATDEKSALFGTGSLFSPPTRGENKEPKTHTL